MSRPNLSETRRAVLAPVVALLFGVVLVAVAGPSASAARAAGPVGAASAPAPAPTPTEVAAAVRSPEPAGGARPVAVRSAGERATVRIALVATAAALAALLTALAALGRAGAPGGDRRRRLGAAPLGARAPPTALAA